MARSLQGRARAGAISGLEPLLNAPGPFVSLYLDATGAAEDAPKELALRWNQMRNERGPEQGVGGLLRFTS